MRGWKIGSLIVVLPVAVFLCLILGGLYWYLPDGHKVKDLVVILQFVVTTTALIYAGIAAAAKLELFRDFAPHLTITHEVSHRPVGDSYVHIAVKASLHNSSKVRVDVRAGIFRIHQIAPLEDSEIEALYAQVFEEGEFTDLQWPTLEEIRPAWDENELAI